MFYVVSSVKINFFLQKLLHVSWIYCYLMIFLYKLVLYLCIVLNACIVHLICLINLFALLISTHITPDNRFFGFNLPRVRLDISKKFISFHGIQIWNFSPTELQSIASPYKCRPTPNLPLLSLSLEELCRSIWRTINDIHCRLFNII